MVLQLLVREESTQVVQVLEVLLQVVPLAMVVSQVEGFPTVPQSSPLQLTLARPQSLALAHPRVSLLLVVVPRSTTCQQNFQVDFPPQA